MPHITDVSTSPLTPLIFCPYISSLERQVKDVMQQAFWDALDVKDVSTKLQWPSASTDFSRTDFLFNRPNFQIPKLFT